MRIAFISGMVGYPWGGSEILWSETAKLLHARGHSVFVSVHGWPQTPPAIQVLVQQGITVHERSDATLLHRLKGRVKRAFRRRDQSRVTTESSASRIKNFRPDLVCISHGAASCGFRWMQWCLKESIPYLSVSQANSELFWPNDEIVDQLGEVYASALSALFVSDANLRLFERQIGRRLPNAAVILNPIQVDGSVRWDWPAPSEVTKLACVARLDAAAKGQDLLLQVLATPPWRTRPIHTSFFGAGPNEKSLKRLATMLGISDRVSFAGHVRSVESVWSDHHALILPSRIEGLPLALVEAMYCGRIPIVTDVAGNTEVVTDGVNGFVAEAPTVPHLAHAMEGAWERRAEWPKLGEAAHRAVASRYERNPVERFADLLLNAHDLLKSVGWERP